MKKIILVLFISLSINMFSQDRKPPKGDLPNESQKNGKQQKEKISVDNQVKKMTDELNLNELQQLQIREILINQEKKREQPSKENSAKERPDENEMKGKMDIEKKELDEN